MTKLFALRFSIFTTALIAFLVLLSLLSVSQSEKPGMRLVRSVSIPANNALAAAFSRDGSLFLANQSGLRLGKPETTIGLWNSGTGELQENLETVDGVVGTIAMSFDNRFIGGVATSRIRILWDVASGRIKQQWIYQPGAGSLVFHPYRPLWAFATFEETRFVDLVDYESGQLIHSLDHGRAAVHGISFSRDGLKLATGADDGAVRIWDVRSGELLERKQQHRHAVYRVAYSSFSEMLASGGWGWVAGTAQSEVFLWNTESMISNHIEPRISRIYDLAFSRDGLFLVIVGGMTKGEMVIWDIRKAKQVWQGHARRPYWSVACSPTEDRLVAAGQEGVIEMWDFSGLRN
jgi:WD40 repeat protein